MTTREARSRKSRVPVDERVAGLKRSQLSALFDGHLKEWAS